MRVSVLNPSSFILTFNDHRDEPYISIFDSPDNDIRRVGQQFVGNQAAELPTYLLDDEIEKVFKDPDAIFKKVLKRLSETEMDVLSIVKRYECEIPGYLLALEMITRNLADEKWVKNDNGFGRLRFDPSTDPVESLMSKMVLVGKRSYDKHYNREGDRESELVYPGIKLWPSIAAQIDKDYSPSWRLEESWLSPTNIKLDGRINPKDVVADLIQMVSAVDQMQGLKINQDGHTNKTQLKKACKNVNLSCSSLPFVLDLEIFYIELLKALEILGKQEKMLMVNQEALAAFSELSLVQQSKFIVRAWMTSFDWQDGLGEIQWEPSYQSRTTILRNQLAWIFTNLAYSDIEWIHLDELLLSFWKINKPKADKHLDRKLNWVGTFTGDIQNYDISERDKNRLLSWIKYSVPILSYMVMITFHHLGLIERSTIQENQKSACWFRLTEHARNVFRTTALKAEPSYQSKPFIVVQPNFDVIVYMDEASTQDLLTLKRITQAKITGYGKVLTLRLEKKSVYHALESGMNLEYIEGFLKDSSKQAIPDSVLLTLREWAGKRDDLVFHKSADLCHLPDPVISKLNKKYDGISVGEKWTVYFEAGFYNTASRMKDIKQAEKYGKAEYWQVNDSGKITIIEKPSILAFARLQKIADKQKDGTWLITEDSIKRVKKVGHTVKQVFHWLERHSSNWKMPDLLDLSIRNWFGRKKTVRMDEV